jgi:hypothetical protein
MHDDVYHYIRLNNNKTLQKHNTYHLNICIHKLGEKCYQGGVIGYTVDLVYLAHRRDQWQDILNIVIILRVP